LTAVAILPPDLASQIAAGEVVERPASVAKELIENSLDAGARRCDVVLEGGGITTLRVTDDGSGMSEADARLAVERHATSKLRSFDDLKRMESFGFRGEALPSIASVSRFTLRTREAAASEGVELVVQGGAPPMVRPAGIAAGTEVCVQDLFFNVPARRKFLRSTSTEAGHVVETVEALALARPDVTFTVARDGRAVREWLRADRRGERVRDVLGELPLVSITGERGPCAWRPTCRVRSRRARGPPDSGCWSTGASSGTGPWPPPSRRLTVASSIAVAIRAEWSTSILRPSSSTSTYTPRRRRCASPILAQ
jgi:DNA mismatch repair protein MutL